MKEQKRIYVIVDKELCSTVLEFIDYNKAIEYCQ